MTDRRSTALVAGCALLLGTAPLVMLFRGLFEWFGPILIMVAGVIGTAYGLRRLRRGPVVQMAGMIIAFVLLLTLMFQSGGEILLVIPTDATLEHFAALLQSAGLEIQDQVIPVVASDGLVFLLAICTGVLAILMDLCVSILRSAALTGLPLLILYVAVVATVPDEVPWMLFIPGAAGYLWVLLTDNVERVRGFGRRFSGDGRGIDRWEPSPLATTGRWLTLVAIPIALILPGLLPGMTSGLIDAFYNGPGGSGPGGNGTTTPVRVDPVAALQGALEASQTTELGIVTTDNPSPGYMKMWSASVLTEDGFQPDLQRSENATPVTVGINPPEVSADVPSQTWEATFTSTGLADVALPLYGIPVFIEAGEEWIYDPRSNTATSSTSTTEGMSYRYEYTDYQYTPELLDTAEPVPDSSPVYRSNTSVPENETVAALVADLTEGADTPYDRVMAIHNHFSQTNGFRYELTTEDGWSGSAIVDFLENKQGFCQQYAGAMAWMVREAGIPARVAIGLTRGNIVREGFRLTNFNFHAWVEVYFQDYGWVPFDPTPSANIRTPADYEWAPDPDRPDSSEPGENPNGPDGDPADNPGQNPTDPTAPNGQNASASVFTGRPLPTVWHWWAAGAGVVAVVLLTPATARVVRRRRRVATADGAPVPASANAWRELLETAQDLGIPIDPGRSPRAASGDLITTAGLSGAAEAGVRHLAAAEERARYAPRPASGTTLATALREARHGMIRAVPLLNRVRADLLPHSLLSRWRRGFQTGVGRFRERSSRIPTALSGLTRRRSG
ncbi:transglutaminase-like putative cysteine protease [Stackebrandtia albiflava]|uniref:Transglutaminase-like putative cysteine protease n=1 Tax=Stackebrandtia albiflava TaxID=406432 RepID=A0A562UPV9_9ACTN|nr:DUF3488 and transglutaminase-like domain-containing protein [Stackebrandtia albiflava]TWJ07650.1 transglutaminase-like putative cysteine protease [Stackebrandtia albiflava]